MIVGQKSTELWRHPATNFYSVRPKWVHKTRFSDYPVFWEDEFCLRWSFNPRPSFLPLFNSRSFKTCPIKMTSMNHAADDDGDGPHAVGSLLFTSSSSSLSQAFFLSLSLLIQTQSLIHTKCPRFTLTTNFLWNFIGRYLPTYTHSHTTDLPSSTTHICFPLYLPT